MSAAAFTATVAVWDLDRPGATLHLRRTLGCLGQTKDAARAAALRKRGRFVVMAAPAGMDPAMTRVESESRVLELVRAALAGGGLGTHIDLQHQVGPELGGQIRSLAAQSLPPGSDAP